MKINLIVIPFIIIIQPKAIESKVDRFIVGGENANNHPFRKYVVSLEIQNIRRLPEDKHFCGGTIIGKDKILTAAHCVMQERYILDPKHIKIIAGIANRKKRTPNSIEYNTKYVVANYDALRIGYEKDTAILTIDGEFPEDNPDIGIISLAESSPNISANCVVLGWGLTSWEGKVSNDLLYIEVKTKASIVCLRVYGYIAFRPKMLCAGNSKYPKKSPCQGDSGGPMICDEKLSGIVCAGIGCGAGGHPALFTDVAKYHDWILDHWNSTTSNAPTNLKVPFKLFVHLFLILFKF